MWLSSLGVCYTFLFLCVTLHTIFLNTKHFRYYIIVGLDSDLCVRENCCCCIYFSDLVGLVLVIFTGLYLLYVHPQ